MTVQDLIDALTELPPEWEVHTTDEMGNPLPVYELEPNREKRTVRIYA